MRRELAHEILPLLLEILQRGEDVGGRGLPHLLLVAEVVAQQVALDPRRDFDVAHGDGVEAALRELPQRHFDQLAPGDFGTFLRPALAYRSVRPLSGRHLGLAFQHVVHAPGSGELRRAASWSVAGNRRGRLLRRDQGTS